MRVEHALAYQYAKWLHEKLVIPNHELLTNAQKASASESELDKLDPTTEKSKHWVYLINS